MTEVAHTIYGEWKDYNELSGQLKTYKCPTCKSNRGILMVRNVTERNGGMHKEFKIVCDKCGHKCGVFWNKTLAESTWNAENDPYWEEQRRRIIKNEEELND